MRNLANFHQCTRKPKNWDFDGIQSRNCMSLKFTEELCVMKDDAKFGDELTCRFKIDMMNLTKFDSSTKSLKNFHFNGLLLSKIYTG